MDSHSVISSAHPAYIESLYKDFRNNPDSIGKEWRSFFEGFDFAVGSYQENGMDISIAPKEFNVLSLIDAYRRKAHLISKTNPIRDRKDRHANLELEYFGLDSNDLNSHFAAGKLLGIENPTLKDILNKLEGIYCKSLGFEYMYIIEPEELKWFQEEIESHADKINFSIDGKKQIFRKLNGSVVFEEFLNIKYVGQKRFSLEGGESTIPALDAIVNIGADLGAEEVIIGMAHRGRLNVLVNILGKTYEQVFNEFEGESIPDQTMGDGDVKYHLGYSSEINTQSGKTINIKVSPNPSHLEAVGPVVIGYCRAKADILYKSDNKKILPILIHGDASVAGQGVVYEVLQMSQLDGYYVGGTIHFVINNQIGFTTDFDDARSTNYSTSVASMLEVPVIHVNGDNVEAVVYAVSLATRYRQKFHKDIFVDMVCYRKHGHNEGDDPKFTQPNLYHLIGKHQNPREMYLDGLVKSGDIEKDLAVQMDREFKESMNLALSLVREKPLPYNYQEPELAWKKLRHSVPKDFVKSPLTSITEKKVYELVEKIIKVPEGFQPLRKVQKMLDKRRKIFYEEKTLDWASAELLGYASILEDGNDVRISGQDSIRGTFSHRHAVLYDEKTNEPHNRLNNLSDRQKASFRIYNSLLSEYGVLGFEFGYSSATPNSLVVWEAQFGDFANGAQVILDQFIATSESKWRRMSGLVLLLPHGYEGQGPEHSSARLERYLQICAEFNMSVVNITTPANFFHSLRRQLARPFRKPLIVMSPKSLLRHQKCISPLNDFTKGGFKEILVDDLSNGNPEKVKKVICCSGKIYYDILARLEKEPRKDLAIIRLEQLYPLPYTQLDKEIAKYTNAKIFWLQEEPSNMGAWVYMLSCYRKVDWNLISRSSSSSTATGFHKIHDEEQNQLINEVFE